MVTKYIHNKKYPQLLRTAVAERKLWSDRNFPTTISRSCALQSHLINSPKDNSLSEMFQKQEYCCHTTDRAEIGHSVHHRLYHKKALTIPESKDVIQKLE